MAKRNTRITNLNILVRIDDEKKKNTYVDTF